MCRLHGLEERTGRLIHVCIEPEPGCVFSLADDAIHFFEWQLFRSADSSREADIIRLGLAGQRQLLAALRGRALTPLELSPDRHRGLLSFLPRHPLPPPSARDLP